MSNSRREDAGLCSTDAALGKPGFDAMTSGRATRGTGCRVWPLEEAEKSSPMGLPEVKSLVNPESRAFKRAIRRSLRSGRLAA